MGKKYMDWTDWAGDHHEEVEAERRRRQPAEQCEHAEVSASGYCTNCGDIVADWEPDDAQLLSQTGTKEPAA